jgi:hypothetical protein
MMSSQTNTTNVNIAKTSARKLRNVKPSAKYNIGPSLSGVKVTRHIHVPGAAELKLGSGSFAVCLKAIESAVRAVLAFGARSHLQVSASAMI